MNPKKLINSRYSLQPVSNKHYNTISVTGSNIIGKKSNSVSEQGYIYMPYIVCDITGTILIDGDTTMMGDLKTKIKKLIRDNKINDLLDE